MGVGADRSWKKERNKCNRHRTCDDLCSALPTNKTLIKHATYLPVFIYRSNFLLIHEECVDISYRYRATPCRTMQHSPRPPARRLRMFGEALPFIRSAYDDFGMSSKVYSAKTSGADRRARRHAMIPAGQASPSTFFLTAICEYSTSYFYSRRTQASNG